jgi:nitrite reductase/ring-hydroxylating ferredoxin subunit
MATSLTVTTPDATMTHFLNKYKCFGEPERLDASERTVMATANSHMNMKNIFTAIWVLLLWDVHLVQTLTISTNSISIQQRSSTHLTAIVENKMEAKISGSATESPFQNFDYNSHWYPVIWAHELRLKEPTKVTVFDVDYVVAKLSDLEVIALKDKCPHKAAALSQGRVTSSGKFQCAYHGWSFDGKSGACVEIPQIVKPDGSMPPVVPLRSCADAVPVQIHQSMVWLFPGGGLEDALLAPPPPSIREVDELGFRMSTSMRDMPVDWPIVLSNIFDPDHGLFAHQAKPFDMYSASQTYPLEVTETYPNNGKGFVLESKVDAVDKLLEVDRTVRGVEEGKKRMNDGSPPIASSVLHLPGHLQLKRVSRTTNSTSFVTGFYICPTGVGRARFMGAACSKNPPRAWLTKLFLDNFLDQDTYLLATQQQNILADEAEEIQRMMAADTLVLEDLSSRTMKTRRNLFCLSSPTEKAGARLEQFWDATLLRVPNRARRLLQLGQSGAFLQTPPRDVVLDRKSQHLDITPSAQDVVSNCQKVTKLSKIAILALGFAKLCSKYWTKLYAVDRILKPWVLVLACGISAILSYIARKITREYYFKYIDSYRRKDLSRIPESIWADK